MSIKMIHLGMKKQKTFFGRFCVKRVLKKIYLNQNQENIMRKHKKFKGNFFQGRQMGMERFKSRELRNEISSSS